jgi:hypothetical protein
MFAAAARQITRLINQFLDCDSSGFCTPWACGCPALAY